MIFSIILLIILIGINGIFSASELAFLSIDKLMLKKDIESGNKKAISVDKILSNSSSFLSTIQIGITLAGFLASAFAAENFASEIADMINITIMSKETLISILIILITIVLSYFTLVFGELVPKKIGLAYSTKISFGMVNIIDLVMVVCKPFIVILKSSTDLVVKLLRIEKQPENIEDDLKNTIIDSGLEELEKKLLLNVFEFNDTTLDKVMTKRDDVVSININSNREEIIKKIREYKYTRFPIMDNDKIIGVLNVKDLIINYHEDFKLENYVRDMVVLKHNMIIDDAFLYLNNIYEAIAVVEKNGEYIGIVTIEDIIEDVVGNVFDEYDGK